MNPAVMADGKGASRHAVSLEREAHALAAVGERGAVAYQAFRFSQFHNSSG